MLNNQKLSLFKLARTEKLSQTNFFRLMSMYNNDAVLALNSIKSNKQFVIPHDYEIKEELELLEKVGGRIVTYQDKEYPWMLKFISDYPPIISVIGDFGKNNDQKRRMISVVGSRNCSILGEKFTHYIIQELVKRNFTIVSGLAHGIDKSAHEETIRNNGSTIAVIGSGLSDFYPNHRLANEIIDNGGLVISELPFNQKPKPQFFPRRNRIIAGLSMATLIVEADIKSGSMITANQALKYDRTVFAVPGFPMDNRSSGTNQLIKDGAIMVRNIDDIMNELHNNNYMDHDSIFAKTVEERKQILQQSNLFNKIQNVDLNELETRIINAINGKTGVSMDDLLSVLPDVAVSSMLIALSELEFKGVIVKSDIGEINLV